MTNTQAERAVVGACLISSEHLAKISEILRPEDFSDINNKIAYEICIDLYHNGNPVDLISFQAEAMNREVFERLGGQPFIAELMSDDAVTSNSIYYAEIVKENSLRRRIHEAGEKISTLANNNEIPANEIIDEVEKIILEASDEKEKTGYKTLKNSLPSLIKKIEDLKNGERKNDGFFTPFTDLNRIIPGFQPGTLNIIAARPSMGKTALALNIAQFGGQTERYSDILFFSLEMSAEQLSQRMLSAQTLAFSKGVKLSSIISGNLTDDDFDIVNRAAQYLQERNNICIYDNSALTAMDFRTKCRRFKTRHKNLGLIVVDYLQLMNSGKKQDNRQYEVAEISKIMKSVAVELECPIVALSQLSRETERRNEKKPQLSDLRDSGAIEQDADTVILLYREDYYNEGESNNEAVLRVAKNRNGSTGTCNLTFQKDFTRFSGIAQ
ncbi:MAG: replicative DNA helicase [Synergistaceae bacterium]|nr:replicative DNA helicase [Synergistaceae bacterium]MBR0317138.1 replicative DNA helicase [Synergistaceae bacterium]